MNIVIQGTIDENECVIEKKEEDIMNIRRFIITLGILWLVIIMGTKFVSRIQQNKNESTQEQSTQETEYSIDTIDYADQKETSEEKGKEEHTETFDSEDSAQEDDNYGDGVNLFELTDILNNWSIVTGYSMEVDSYGNEHQDGYLFTAHAGIFESDEEYTNNNSAILYLNQQYTTIELKNLFLTQLNQSIEEATYLAFYDYDIDTGKRRLITTSTKFKKLVSPESMEVDVTNVEYLQICIEGKGCYLGCDSAWIQ